MFLRSGALFAAAGGKVVGAKGLGRCGWGMFFGGGRAAVEGVGIVVRAGMPGYAPEDTARRKN